MANEHKQALSKFIGRGGNSRMSYSIDVEDGRILYTTENEGHAFMRDGDASSTQRKISLDDLKNHRVRGGNYYEAARAEVERQLQLMKNDDSETECRTPETKTAEEVSLRSPRPRQTPAASFSPPNRKRLGLSSEAHSKLFFEAFPMLANGFTATWIT
jgi:hypothetical protein